MVDVQDFMEGGSVNVRSAQDRQLTVEGQVETQTGGERYKKHFHRRFVLPRDIFSESVTSVVSADGVLTITAPKKVSLVPRSSSMFMQYPSSNHVLSPCLITFTIASLQLLRS